MKGICSDCEKERVVHKRERYEYKKLCYGCYNKRKKVK